jgi:hypothetical protein
MSDLTAWPSPFWGSQFIPSAKGFFLEIFAGEAGLTQAIHADRDFTQQFCFGCGGHFGPTGRPPHQGADRSWLFIFHSFWHAMFLLQFGSKG